MRVPAACNCRTGRKAHRRHANEARYYKAISSSAASCKTVKKAGKHFVVVTDKDTVEADYVLSTLSVGALNRHGVRFDNTARLAAGSGPGGMTAAK